MMDTRITFAAGMNFPSIFPQGKVVVVSYDTNNDILNNGEGSAVNARNQYPLTFKVDGLPDFKFPIDPIISLSFKNVITRRIVSKGTKRGSVKERWTEDDVDITITGVFINEDDDNPPQEIDQLRAFFEQHKAIDVVCTLLTNHDITKIAIESLDLPFTKGIRNQTFQIKAYSDDVFQLLIEG